MTLTVDLCDLILRFYRIIEFYDNTSTQSHLLYDKINEKLAVFSHSDGSNHYPLQ